MARILIISHIFPPAVDGGSRVIWKIGEYLAKNGHEVVALCSNARSTDDFTHSYSPVLTVNSKLITVNSLSALTLFHRPFKFLSKYLFKNQESKISNLFSVFSKGPVFKIIPFLKFLVTCYLSPPDFIIAGPLPTTIVLYARLIRKFTGARLLINASFHPTDPDFQNKLLIDTLKSADLLWTLTDYETNYFHQNFNIPFSRMLNLGNGIDKNFLIKKLNFKFKISNFKLLFVGSFAAHKDLETLFAALQLLPKNYRLTIAGKSTLHSLTISKNITVIHDFPDSDLAKIIDRCQVLISPSRQESFGLTLLEAMARGKPVIAANIPASAELIKKSGAGLLFKPGNPADLAAKIIKITRSKNQMDIFSKKGLTFATTRTWDRIGESLWQKLSSS